MGWKARSENLTSLVPARTFLKLNATNGGIQLTDISGCVVAQTLKNQYQNLESEIAAGFAWNRCQVEQSMVEAQTTVLRVSTEIFTSVKETDNSWRDSRVLLSKGY